MRKAKMLVPIVAGFALVLFTTAMAFSQPGWISVEGKADQEKPSAVVQRSDKLETVIEFQTKGFFVDEVREDKGTFHVLRLPYYHTTLEVGKPQLPAISEMIGIPDNSVVSVRIIDSTVVTLDGYRVYPFQTPLLEGEERVGFDMDEELYSRNLFYPENIAEVEKPSIWRDLRTASLRVYPIRYNPATGELKVYTKLTVKLEYHGISRTNVLIPRGKSISPVQEEIYRSTILNYNFMEPSREKRSKQDYDLLIIYVDRFGDEATSLKNWKDSQGIQTQITPLSMIPTNPVDIKAYINNQYTNYNISYVLLIGDIAELPAYTGYTYRYGTIVSDYWYALLTGDDFLPEIAVGRISGTTDVEVDNVISKTIAFEDNPQGDWLDEALLVAHRQDAPGKYQRCKQEILTATDTQSGTYRNLYPNFTTAYGAQGATNQNVIDAIDDGRIVVNYRGHGSTSSWSTWNTTNQSFASAQVALLNNGSMTPVIFSIACYNNQLDAAQPCLGEAFTNVDDGAVAFLGASRPSYTTPNHDYDKQLFATVFDEGNINIGHASNIAAIRMMEDHGDHGRDNAKMYLWLGDPSLAFPVDPDYVSHWLILFDLSGSMSTGERMDRAKEFATRKVTRTLQDSDDLVALASFAGNQHFNLIVDWTRDEQTLINQIQNLSPGGMSPLADAACAAADKLINDVEIPPNQPLSRFLVFITDGGENYSTGECSGPADPTPNPPWCDNEDSWHCLVLNKLMGNAIVDVGYFGNLGPVAGEPARLDDIPSKGEDEDFFKDLADSSGGGYYDPESTAICGNGILEPGEQCEIGYPCDVYDLGGTRYICVNCQCVRAAIGACCVESGCIEGLTPEQCDSLDGRYLGDGTTCEAAQCPTLTQWGVIILVLLILVSAGVILKRQRAFTKGAA